MDELRLVTKVYIATLVLATLGLASFLLAGITTPDREGLVLAVAFAGLEAAAMLFPLNFSSDTKVVFNTVVVFATTLLFVPGIAMLVVGGGTLLAYLARRQAWDETLFNSSQIMLQAGVGGCLLTSVGWNFDQLVLNRPALLPMVFLTAGAMYLIELSSVTMIVALEAQQSPLRIWRQVTPFDSIEIVSQFTLGFVTAVVADVYAWILPLLLTLATMIYRSRKRQLQLHKQSEAFMHQAFHDPLTGLPNRALFLDRLAHALARAAGHQQAIAILFLDLDRFKLINDSLGHEMGDQLLVAVAKRLQACLRPEDTVARLGGDEFTILVEDITQVADATSIADRIKELLQAPFLLAGHEVVITTSIGIALSGAGFGRHTPGELLRDADSAMYKAKYRGKAHHQISNGETNNHILDRLQLETDLYQAIEKREFRVYYQPQVEVMTGRIIGLEALVRWNHPTRGLLLPNEFIPLAEETKLILPIGYQVLEEACWQARTWQEQYPHHHSLSVSVNLSARQFQDPQLVEKVAQVLERTTLEASSLQLEITESVLMEDIPSAIAKLQHLRALEVQIAIDDFGTGYSSLNYLKHFPADFLKIDKSFIAGVAEDPGDIAIVRAVTTLAQTLGIQVVAEGVETAEQLAQLQALECDGGQGFLFSPPRPNEAIAAMLAEHSSVHGMSPTSHV